MVVETQDIVVETGAHVVQFYEHDSELVGAVGPYLAAAARAGEVAIVIATEAHQRAFAAALEAEGIHLAQISAEGRFLSLDAGDTMATFIADGQIDHDAFHEVIGGLVGRALESAPAVRVYGEMVALLRDQGDMLAAIELETLWNDLAHKLPFSLFCSYPSASVAGSEHVDALHQVCHLHSSVLHPPANDEQDAADGSTQTELLAEFAAERDSPGLARRLVVAALRRWGLDETLVGDAALVLSELSTNAVVHAGSRFSVIIRAEDSTLRIAVQDARPLAATVGEQGGLIARTGHGLSVIEKISTCWGAEGTADGKVVWAELPCRSRDAGG